MFFVIKSTIPNADLARYRARKQIRLALLLYRKSKWSTAEILLERRLRECGEGTLFDICQQIINKSAFYLNQEQEIIVKIPDPRLNRLARLITYGDEKTQGSRILREIFNVD